jgi:hypothetical protein
MTKVWWISGGVMLLGIAAVAPAIQGALVARGDEVPIVATEPNEALKSRSPSTRAATPMAGREATLGLLNKRNGLSRDLKIKPGEAVRIGDAVIRLKACDQSEPWEREQLTGGFVQLIVRGADTKWRKVFSGWLYKETPSLNVVEHPIYDVWVKACAMAHPDIGPDTVVMSDDDGGKPTRPKAKKSPSRAAASEYDIAEPSETM